jgi:hypothetical protein
MTTDSKLDKLLAGQAQMQKLLEAQHRNILVLYRRTTALALMLEAISKDEKLKMPKVIRAEIDASLRPEEFVNLAEKDPAEFKLRYGQTAYDVLMKQGIDAIGRVYDMTSPSDNSPLMQ